MYETAYPVAAVHQTLVSLYKTRHVTSILASAGHTCICKGILWRALEMVEYWFSSCQSSDPFFTHIVFGVSIGFVHLDAIPRLLRLRKACPQLPPKRPKLHSSTSPLSWLQYSMLEKHEVAQVMVINDGFTPAVTKRLYRSVDFLLSSARQEIRSRQMVTLLCHSPPPTPEDACLAYSTQPLKSRA